jgi:hypothetical protein
MRAVSWKYDAALFGNITDVVEEPAEIFGTVPEERLP